uniref:Methyltransferase type 11 domain-containing protein n=1 Tax=Plectus sambesii TaxID=2011161 RepID=A0A914VF77_9BILA
MALLPRSNTEFADPNYWRSFFEKRQTPFEWYGDFNQIGSSLERYLKPQDAIIQIGCGNSLLAEQLYDNGYRRVTSIDTDQGVIDKQRSRNANNRPELLFERADASRLTYEAGTFSAVLDKGTLDALFPPDADDATRSTVKSMFSEVQRVLSPGGRYIVVTLAQEHILQKWLSYFSETHEFILRIHKCAKCDDGFVMPVFLLIATRLKAPMPGQPILELSLADAANKAKRMSSVDELVENVRAAQEYNWFCHMCSE